MRKAINSDFFPFLPSKAEPTLFFPLKFSFLSTSPLIIFISFLYQAPRTQDHFIQGFLLGKSSFLSTSPSPKYWVFPLSYGYLVTWKCERGRIGFSPSNAWFLFHTWYCWICMVKSLPSLLFFTWKLPPLGFKILNLFVLLMVAHLLQWLMKNPWLCCWKFSWTLLLFLAVFMLTFMAFRAT